MKIRCKIPTLYLNNKSGFINCTLYEPDKTQNVGILAIFCEVKIDFYILFNCAKNNFD